MKHLNDDELRRLIRMDQGDSYVVHLPDGTVRGTGYTAEGPHDHSAETLASARRIYEEWYVAQLRPSDGVLYVALRDLGFPDLAQRAAVGEWSDYFGPHAMPQHHLVATLRERANDFPSKRTEIEHVVSRTIAGDFDGTREEAQQWAASAEGRDVFDELLGKRKP